MFFEGGEAPPGSLPVPVLDQELLLHPLPGMFEVQPEKYLFTNSLYYFITK